VKHQRAAVAYATHVTGTVRVPFVRGRAGAADDPYGVAGGGAAASLSGGAGGSGSVGTVARAPTASKSSCSDRDKIGTPAATAAATAAWAIDGGGGSARHTTAFGTASGESTSFKTGTTATAGSYQSDAVRQFASQMAITFPTVVHGRTEEPVDLSATVLQGIRRYLNVRRPCVRGSSSATVTALLSHTHTHSHSLAPSLSLSRSHTHALHPRTHSFSSLTLSPLSSLALASRALRATAVVVVVCALWRAALTTAVRLLCFLAVVSQEEPDCDACPLCFKVIKLRMRKPSNGKDTPQRVRTERSRRWDHLRKIHEVVGCESCRAWTTKSCAVAHAERCLGE
jgi:hypothetical protein